jgi:acetyl-CoA acetyltransferase
MHANAIVDIMTLARPRSTKEPHMPEAVIVSTARSPIGRANKGSLKDMRPDDLTVQMVKAALAKVDALDPRDINDLHLGVGQPAEMKTSPSPALIAWNAMRVVCSDDEQ